MSLTIAAGAIEPFDPDIAGAIEREARRQHDGLELIASENYPSEPVLAAMGSILTNKYAEGYPGRRYYGGCEFVDVVETLAIERAKALFGADHANVQSHSGSQANLAAYYALLEPGDTAMGLELNHGGHLSHGLPVNISGRWFQFVSYGVDRETERIDYDAMQAVAREHRPKLIVVGATAYPRHYDFARAAEIAEEVDATLMVDMAHFAGLVAGGVHPSPVPYSPVVTTTTHKTLRGPRSALILTNDAMARPIDRAVFPGTSGGPHMHTIAAKAIALKEAATPSSPPTPRRSWPTPRPWPRASRARACGSSPAAPTTISCSSMSASRVSPAKPPRPRSTPPGSPPTRTPSPTTSSAPPSPAACGSAPPPSPRAACARSKWPPWRD